MVYLPETWTEAFSFCDRTKIKRKICFKNVSIIWKQSLRGGKWRMLVVVVKLLQIESNSTKGTCKVFQTILQNDYQVGSTLYPILKQI